MAIRNTQEWRRASRSFQVALKNIAPKVTKSAVVLLEGASEDFLTMAENLAHAVVPYYTGNLLDSIAVRILNGSTIVSYRTMVETTTQHALKPQRMRGVSGDIWGEVEAMKRISRPSGRTQKGLAAQMFVGVPYADNVGGETDENGKFNAEYFDQLSDIFVRRVEKYISYLSRWPQMPVAGWRNVLNYKA